MENAPDFVTLRNSVQCPLVASSLHCLQASLDCQLLPVKGGDSFRLDVVSVL